MGDRFPAAFISESTLPDVVESLRNGGFNVQALETCRYDRGIGVRLLLRCVVENDAWGITIQAAPPTAPDDLIVVLRAEGGKHSQPIADGAEAIWSALRSGGIDVIPG